MSLPNSAAFALIEINTGTMAEPVWTKLCGIENVNINRAAQTSESYRRNCEKLNRPGQRKIRVTGASWTISGSGSDNIDLEEEYADAFGVRKSYRVTLYEDDGTDAGAELGAYAGSALMTARNQGYSQESAGTLEVTLEGEGELTWAVAD